MLADGTHVVITGGNFTDIGRDQVNIYHLHISQPPTGPIVVPGTSLIPSNSSRRPLAVEYVPPPDDAARTFAAVEMLLQAISQLVSRSNEILKTLRTSVSELQATVAFAKRAYSACKGTTIACMVRAQIRNRMDQCAATLLRVHQRVGALPYRWVPSQLDIGQLLLKWLARTAEPEDIVFIRLELVGEIEALGECLGSLKSFVWATGLWSSVLAKQSFSMRELSDFFSTGPPSLRYLRVEEIIVIEPLGSALSIPLRFVRTLEDIHRFVELGCQGSKGSAFIEGRQYQLDEASTDQPIDESRVTTLKHGTVLEVSVRLKAFGMALLQCPRCAHVNDGTHVRNGWIKCQGCRILFSATEASEAHKTSNVKQEIVSESSLEPSPDHAVATHNLSIYIFRRLKLEVFNPLKATQDVLVSTKGSKVRRNLGRALDLARKAVKHDGNNEVAEAIESYGKCTTLLENIILELRRVSAETSSEEREAVRRGEVEPLERVMDMYRNRLTILAVILGNK